MSNKRIVSFSGNTNVYHKPDCKYVKKILSKNQMEITRKEATDAGYRSCKCCNGMRHQMTLENSTMKKYENEKNMQFRYVDGILYVKTEIGCWKLVYSRSHEKIAIYHRNHCNTEVDFSNPQEEYYHRQADISYVNSIHGALEYIYKHDRYKALEISGQKITYFSKDKYRKSAEKRLRRKNQRRVDWLFKQLETKDSRLVQYSFC